MVVGYWLVKGGGSYPESRATPRSYEGMDKAQSLMKEGLSTLKAAKSGVTWWLPILEAVAHRAISEIRERLEWAVDFLSKNARRTKQRKSIQNRTLEGILIDAFS